MNDMSSFSVGDKVMIKANHVFGYICDDTDCEDGHYIVDSFDFMETSDPKEYLVDVDEKSILKVI